MRLGKCTLTLVDVAIIAFITVVLAVIAIPSLLRSRMTANTFSAPALLQQLVAHESAWRLRDPDGNGQADYWVKDVAGFHAVGRKPAEFIDLAFARADEAPAFWYPELGGVLSPKQGYGFRAMRYDQDGRPYVARTGVALATAFPAAGICTNPSRFGFTAGPRIFSSDGILHFMVGEDGVVWQKDISDTILVTSRATAAPPGSDTTWARFGGFGD